MIYPETGVFIFVGQPITAVEARARKKKKGKTRFHCDAPASEIVKIALPSFLSLSPSIDDLAQTQNPFELSTHNAARTYTMPRTS